ncbi:DUF2470 domain-containing protein [Streptomyces phytohabitans]|uniref:DUF2470 domain-containing protein n=1 Tax=Streptomyces phytohabitans TaxID=1150371 RepID=UPI00345C21BE
MRLFRSRATQPTPAERVQSILAVAHSMTVVCGGRRYEVHRLHGSGAHGHVHLHAPVDPGTPREHGEHGDPGEAAPRVPVRLELTDVAPTPVRQRLRARLTLTGTLPAPYDPESAESACMEFGGAELEEAGTRTSVPLDRLRETAADPLAGCEASMLTHLLDGHAEYVPLLLRLVRPHPGKGLVRALPVALDRYGLTLRLEYAGAHRDVRLAFATAVSDPADLGTRIQGLVAAARRASHPNHLPA